MAPHSRAASAPCIKDWGASNLFNYFTWLIIFVLLSTTVYRSFLVLASRRSYRRMSSPGPSQEKEASASKPTSKRVDSGMTEDQNQRLQALRRELAQQHETVTPIHPWIAPPTPLPGPYDAPYYPLPMPTLRRHSQDPSPGPSEQEETVSYTHHVTTPSNPTRQTVLPIRGTTTVSNHGWKRTQWTVSAG